MPGYRFGAAKVGNRILLGNNIMEADVDESSRSDSRYQKQSLKVHRKGGRCSGMPCLGNLRHLLTLSLIYGISVVLVLLLP